MQSCCTALQDQPAVLRDSAGRGAGRPGAAPLLRPPAAHQRAGLLHRLQQRVRPGGRCAAPAVLHLGGWLHEPGWLLHAFMHGHPTNACLAAGAPRLAAEGVLREWLARRVRSEHGTPSMLVAGCRLPVVCCRLPPPLTHSPPSTLQPSSCLALGWWRCPGSCGTRRTPVGGSAACATRRACRSEGWAADPRGW